MKSANKFDDQESLPVPDNHILAIIKNPEEAEVVVEALNESGFSPDDIGLLKGEADAAKLEHVVGGKDHAEPADDAESDQFFLSREGQGEAVGDQKCDKIGGEDVSRAATKSIKECEEKHAAGQR